MFRGILFEGCYFVFGSCLFQYVIVVECILTLFIWPPCIFEEILRSSSYSFNFLRTCSKVGLVRGNVQAEIVCISWECGEIMQEMAALLKWPQVEVCHHPDHHHPPISWGGNN